MVRKRRGVCVGNDMQCTKQRLDERKKEDTSFENNEGGKGVLLCFPSFFLCSLCIHHTKLSFNSNADLPSER